MNHMRHIYALHTALSLLLFACPAFSGHARGTVAVDSLTGNPVPKASVFDKKGNRDRGMLRHGLLPPVPASAYPLTISSMGYAPASVGSLSLDTVVLRGTEYELPEVLVESKKHQVLHMIGYVREYSTLTTYSDTVMLFREKTVDFMVPVGRGKEIPGMDSAKGARVQVFLPVLQFGRARQRERPFRRLFLLGRLDRHIRRFGNAGNA